MSEGPSSPPTALSAAGLDLLQEAAAELGQPLTPEQLLLFSRLYGHLQAASAQMNLTALQAERDVVLKHFADSLGCLRAGDWASIQTLLDLGTGAGFPALPLAIALPRLKVTALDATAKKVAYVERTARELGLEVTGLTGRAEEVGRSPAARSRYDGVVTRAVASLPVLLELGLPLLREGGQLLAQKGQLSAEERAAGLRAAELLGAVLETEDHTPLPISGDPRCLLVFRKVQPTPENYPRRTGIPNKRPLGST